MFAAGNDTIVSTRAVEDFAVRAKVSSCILMPGSKHEILQENDAVRTRFWAAFDAYLGVEMKVAVRVRGSREPLLPRARADRRPRRPDRLP
jgi:lysophospholipase